MSSVEHIKERLGIVDVVGSYVTLTSAGVNFKAKCPFHNEKTPSFMVSPARNTYHCFGCNASGDIFSFVEQFEGLDFKGALSVLASRAGVELVPERRGERDERDRYFALMEAAACFYETRLVEHLDARNYLTRRGVSEETMRSFRVGYAPESWRAASEYFGSLGYKPEDMITVGLIKRSERGNESYDRFRGRIMFPLTDGANRVIAFSGRLLPEVPTSSGELPAKYLNSPETPLYHKSRVLYGYADAKSHIRRLNCSIVVEGQMDLILSHQAGFKNTVALSGTALTRDQLTLLKRFSPNIILAFDSDTAGEQALMRSAREALALDMDVKAVALPAGSDPADIIGENPDTWKKTVKEAKHIIDFLPNMITAQDGDERSYRRRMATALFPLLASMENRVDRSYFIPRVARRLGMADEDLIREIARSNANSSRASGEGALFLDENPADKKERGTTIVERMIRGIHYWQASLTEPQVDTQLVATEWMRIMGTSLTVIPDVRESLAFEAEAAYGSEKDVSAAVSELLYRLEHDCLKRDLEDASRALKRAEISGNDSVLAHELNRCNELRQRIADLSSHRRAKLSIHTIHHGA